MGPPRGRLRGQTEQNRNFFKIKVKLVPTDEVFNLTQVYSDMKIRELKAYLEFSTGIPTHIQRISYLDEGELLDDTDMRSNDIVPNATLHLRVWPMWTSLVEAVAQNDFDLVMSLGVTNPSSYRSPNSDYMTKRAKKVWLEERAAVALSLAASRGLDKMCHKLIESGADVNSATEDGRTALHIASAQGHGHIVDLLLERGADIDAEDDFGATALSIADRFGFKSCGRHLFLFHWQQRAKKVAPARNIPLMAHQKTDSLYPVWKRGQKSQVYIAHLSSNGEFEGTGLDAPKRGVHPSVRHKMERDRVFSKIIHPDDGSHHESEEGDYFPNVTEELRTELPPVKSSFMSDKYLKKTRPLKKPETQKEWLQKIKDEEDKLREVKRKIREEQKQKKLEEDEKHKEESERLGYEKWLQQRQQEKVDRLSRAITATSRSRREYGNKEEDDDGEDHPGALRVYLRSLGCSKAGVSYEQWLNDKEKEVYAMPAGPLKPKLRNEKIAIPTTAEDL